MRSLFGVDSISQFSLVESLVEIEPSRSPFITNRLDIFFEEKSLEELKRQVRHLELRETSFKVVYVKSRAFSKSEMPAFEQRCRIEREVGWHIRGKADMVEPQVVFGIMLVNGKWVFGEYHENKAVWLRHKNKPNSYSTSLNTRLARAVVNIAIPDSKGVKAIDPCCGIGTVVVEALSMGIDIVASDINPQVMNGARENIAHFGFKTKVALQDLREITGNYDVSIIDLPYNLCSVLPDKDKLEMLQHARKFSKKTVVITTEPIDSFLETAGFQIADRCEWKKRAFTRQVIVCE